MIVGVLACSALAVTMGMAASDPLYRPHLGSMLALMAFWMAVAATIAIFGSYKLAELRQQVRRGAEAGTVPSRRARSVRVAMGEVFLAEHLMLKQPCAIKLIRPELAANRTAMQRFEREVHAISRLKHWNTVQIYDYGYAEDGTFYFAMEYLAGLTLEALVREHGPSAGRARDSLPAAGVRGVARGARHAARAPRHQACQRHRVRARRTVRRGQAARLRHGAAGGTGGDGRDGDQRRGHRRHAGVHVSRTDRGRAPVSTAAAISTALVPSPISC